ncbi:MAG: lipocalin family protein [Rhodoferax sp.]
MKSALIVSLLSLLASSALAADPAGAGAAPPVTATLGTISSLDVPRYMGVWYEIAKYPNWFQRKCVRNTKADYSQQADGTVRVINNCLMNDGQVNEAAGTARQIGPANSAKLEVRFAPAWLSFVPAVWGDYWVIDLDPEYRLAAVAEPKREYLWVLSRTPTVSQKAYQDLMTRLVKKGFDTDKLEITRQQD